MKPARPPVLVEGGSSLDWQKASYKADVQLKGSQAIVIHHLQDAPQLDCLLKSGKAQWVTEVRCPRTLLYRQQQSSEPTQKVLWTADETIGQIYLVPGLVAVQDLVLEPSGLNPFVWHPNTTINIPCGWWLAKSAARQVISLTASLVKFQVDINLSDGQMAVDEDTDGGNPCFVVRMASNIYDERKEHRDIQIAGLIGACARLPSSSMGRDSNGNKRENYNHALADELRSRFEAAEVPDWSSDEFDPIQAATFLEPFDVVIGESE